MDFGRPNAEIGRKMANGRMLFLALHLAECYIITLRVEVMTVIHVHN